MTIYLPLAGAFDHVQWLGTTVPFFSVLSAFVGGIWLVRFFVREIQLRPAVSTTREGEYRFNPEEFD